MQLLAQVLDWALEADLWPERLQFERNNLTDAAATAPILAALHSVYDCWAPPNVEDVHCSRMRDMALGRPATSSSVSLGGEASRAADSTPLCSMTSGNEELPWWRVELPDSVGVAVVRVTGRGDCCAEDLVGWEVRVGNDADPERNPVCARPGQPAMAPGATRTLECRAHGRYVAVLRPHSGDGPRPPMTLCRVEALGVATELGAARVSVGRQCCHGGCARALTRFDGFDARCEARCRADPECSFFTTYASLWCTTLAGCDEDIPATDSSAVTYSIRPSSPWLPLPLHNARQSSMSEWGGGAERAVDGRHEAHFLAGSCSHTAELEPHLAADGKEHWWVAETREERPVVAAVRLQNRWDCCHERLLGFEVRVGEDPDPRKNALCEPVDALVAQEPVPQGGHRLVRCRNRLAGRYIGVVLSRSEALTLCEVEAFSTYASVLAS
eukprot:TRINITY_DN30251_c0_g1_i2.p1 TRINITY_DN30251_c0_g1~~TRINITY_DN30251_c0_g1_i2.p1  ORF type:complete len:442 (-),score=58.70 TRINITY_DN30251_c0_g1_i2:123-1448(-)